MSFFRNFFDNKQPENHIQYDNQHNYYYESYNQPEIQHNTQYHNPYNPYDNQ